MPKRFTDTDIWKTQRWFRKLNPVHKLVFCYIKDQCSHSGLWKIDCSDLIEDLGLEEFDLKKFIDAINSEFDKITGKKTSKERLRVIKSNFLWITGFIQFQYEGRDKMVKLSAPVRTGLLELQSVGVLKDGLDKGYISLEKPLTEGWQTPKDKDKDNNKYSLNNKRALKGAKAVKFDKAKENAIFEDGSTQPLGKEQKELAKENRISAQAITKGNIY